MDRRETAVLLQRAREGAPGAFDELYRRCAGRLLTFIRVRLGPSLRSRLDSTDILQATLLKSFERFRQFEQSDAASLMAWLTTIAHNEIRDQADRQGRQRRDVHAEVPLEWPEALAAPAAAQRGALTQVILDERAQQLERALEALDEHYREVILLRDFEELTFPEIGARLARTEDAARMLYARAMAALTMRVMKDGART